MIHLPTDAIVECLDNYLDTPETTHAQTNVMGLVQQARRQLGALKAEIEQLMEIIAMDNE